MTHDQLVEFCLGMLLVIVSMIGARLETLIKVMESK